MKHVVKLQEATLANVQRLWWTGYHRQDLSLPMPHAIICNNRAPGHASSTTPDSDSDGSVRPHPGASSFRPSPTVVHGPRELLQEFTIALRNEYLEPFTAWTQGELDEMVRRKKDKDSRPTYKTIARFLQKPIEEVKQAWKVYQRLEARG